MPNPPTPVPVFPVENAVDIHGSLIPLHTVLDAPNPVPITQKRPVKFLFVTVAAADLNPLATLTNGLSAAGQQGFRLAAFAPVPGYWAVAVLQQDQ
jgi:hypothetical protein